MVLYQTSYAIVGRYDNGEAAWGSTLRAIVVSCQSRKTLGIASFHGDPPRSAQAIGQKILRGWADGDADAYRSMIKWLNPTQAQED